MPMHYEVKNYETLATYLAPRGITLPAESIVKQVVWSSYLHYQSPWFAYAVHLMNMKRKYGVNV